MAKLWFIHSPMSAGKTATLLMKTYSFEKNGIPVMLMKPATDTRDGDGIIRSRIGLEHECYLIGEAVDSIWYELMPEYIEKNGYKPKWLLVDEAQFLEPKHVDALAWIVDRIDINVMCYGLRTDFQGNLFPGSKRLFELADSIEELKMTCSCGRKAIINARVDSDGGLVIDGPQVEVGGDARYVSICRKCYNRRLFETMVEAEHRDD